MMRADLTLQRLTIVDFFGYHGGSDDCQECRPMHPDYAFLSVDEEQIREPHVLGVRVLDTSSRQLHLEGRG